MNTFHTHDNGGRPFKVDFESDPENCTTAHVSKLGPDEHERYTLLFTINFQKAFIGHSRRCKMTIRGGSYGDDYTGNSILLNIQDLEYMHIGASIFKFKAISPIIKYESPVGRNDVPYPWAKDSEGRYYLMIENVILTITPQRLKNPYMYYYDNTSLRRHCITTIENCASWINLNFQSDPCKHYDWLTKPNVIRENSEELPDGLPVLDTPKMYLERSLCQECAEEHQTYTELSKIDYINLMTTHAEQNGFLKLKKEIVHERL